MSPVTVTSTVTSTLAQVGHQVGRAASTLRWFVRGVTGADAYERYCAHLRTRHPEQPVPDERQFWKDLWAEQDRQPRSRCC